MKARAWEKLDCTDLYQGDIFSLRKEHSRSPNSEREHEFDILDSPDWVNVIALTAEGMVILIRQYRHGTGEITTEIPGGMIDPGEDPLEAARRELGEETGYQATEWEGIGTVEPNPAFQTNTTYTFLARGAHLAGEPRLDENEEIEVFEHPLGNIWHLFEGGTIKHALVLCAFFHLIQHGDLALPGR